MLKRRRSSIDHCVFFLSSAIVLLSLCLLNSASSSSSSSSPSPSDELALLAFKSKADLNNRLDFRSMKNSSLHFCKWQGVTCLQQKVVRLVLQSLYLGGVFAPDTLTRLDQLRVLSLQNNSLTGSIPDLSQLVNLKSLYLDHNSFTGFFPRPILSLRRLRTIDFSYNNLTGSIPSWLANLDRLYYLRLEWNRFNGTVPSFNQSSLETFNVTGNNLTGAIPVTPTLLRFGPSSFLWNPGLCGEILNKECHPSPPFFGPTAAVEMASPPPTVALGQNAEAHGHFEFTDPPQKSYKQTAVVIGFSFGVFVLIGSLLCFLLAARKRQRSRKKSTAMMYSDREVTAQAAAVMQIEQENAELEEKVKKVQEMQVGKSGCLLFCAGEAHLYTLDQLMKASAELLGKGTMGTTYKAVMDNRLIVTVKRLDAVKLAGTNKEIVERHLESVGGLRHPNLVPLRAFFQAKEEKLLIYDYQPNGSLFSLIHGSKSTRAKPLHWTSCLKIAEDVAQGLAYIHQAWRLVHGNLKSSNVLLGADFEACLTDYCISVLAGDSRPGEDKDGDSNAYRSPETRNSMKVDPSATPKSDVYAFGILLAELLTGKVPSQHPVLVPDDMTDWVRSCREDGRGGEGEEDERMTMLVEVAIACSLPSPEQRPTMWQVLKMLQEIKETVLLDDSNEMVHPTGPSL